MNLLDPRDVRRPAARARLSSALLLAGCLAGCANPHELLTGSNRALSVGGPVAVAPWQTRASVAAEAVRALTEPEGELVVATAIAAHEMRRP